MMMIEYWIFLASENVCQRRSFILYVEKSPSPRAKHKSVEHLSLPTLAYSRTTEPFVELAVYIIQSLTYLLYCWYFGGLGDFEFALSRYSVIFAPFCCGEK